MAQDISRDGESSEFFRAEPEGLHRLVYVILGSREIAEDIAPTLWARSTASGTR